MHFPNITLLGAQRFLDGQQEYPSVSLPLFSWSPAVYLNYWNHTKKIKVSKGGCHWRWRSGHLGSVGGWRVFCRANALYSYCVIWVPACSVKCRVSTSREELSVHLLPLPWGGGSWVIFELSSWYNSAVQPMEQTELVKVFPARNVLRIVLLALCDVSWTQAAVLRIIPLLKIYSQAYSHCWQGKRQ